jgi:hypothetical protein
MVAYLKSAMALCRVTGIQPSFLLHPLDVLGGDEAPALRFFPGMDLATARKLELFRKALRLLGEHFELVPMSTHARALLARPDLALREPALAA